MPDPEFDMDAGPGGGKYRRWGGGMFSEPISRTLPDPKFPFSVIQISMAVQNRVSAEESAGLKEEILAEPGMGVELIGAAAEKNCRDCFE